MDIKTAPVPICPVCGEKGTLTIEGAADYITELQGSWTFRECVRCHTLWQDPAPLREEIGKLYPENYHFTHSVPELWINQKPGLPGSAKLAILEGRFGYEGITARAGSPLGVALGRIAAAVGLAKERAGRAVRYLHAKKGGRLLDVGCGNGGFLSLMKDLGWECDGVEPDPVAAGVAVKLGHNVRQGSVEDLALSENHYDAVTLSHVMEHFPDPHVAMAAIAKVLKPGGIFFSVSPNPAGFLRRTYRDKWYGLMAPQHLVIPTAQGYRDLCAKAGLRAKCWTSTANCFWYIRESISIQRTGATGKYSGTLWPKLVALGTTLARPLFPDIGEEAVCYAVKE